MKKLTYRILLGIPIILELVACSPKESSMTSSSRVTPLLGLKDVKSKTGLDLPKDSRLLMSEIGSRENSERWVIQMSSTNHVQFPGPGFVCSEHLSQMEVKRFVADTGISISGSVVVSNGGVWNMSSNIQCSVTVIVSGKDEYIELERLF